MDWLLSLICFLFGHKKPYSDFLTWKMCPRCYRTVEIETKARPLSEGTRTALRELKKKSTRIKKRGF